VGDKNQSIYINKFKDILEEPYLEVGSKDYGDRENLRAKFPNKKYVGIDMLSGKNVDKVIDLTLPFEKIDKKLNGMRFSTIFCFSVLEHCDNPFMMAENLTKLLKPKGKLVLGVPFSFKIHGYPSDYWRFTYEGIKVLFPSIKWHEEDCYWHTSKDNDFRKIDKDMGKEIFSGKYHRDRGNFLKGLSMDLLKIPKSLGLYNGILSERHIFVPTNIDMIGELK